MTTQQQTAESIALAKRTGPPATNVINRRQVSTNEPSIEMACQCSCALTFCCTAASVMIPHPWNIIYIITASLFCMDTTRLVCCPNTSLSGFFSEPCCLTSSHEVEALPLLSTSDQGAVPETRATSQHSYATFGIEGL